MLSIIVGKVGSGKSLYGLHLLLEELRHRDRQVVTTLPVDVGALNAYVQKQWPKETVDVCARVTRLDKDGLRQFWRHRGAGIIRGPFGSADWQTPDGGVAYFLDEAQEGFSARHWQEAGREFTSYATQHRKLGDDIICMTPAAALLDKQFRLLAGECVIMSNWYQIRLKGFTMPRRIISRSYQNCPPAPGEVPLATGSTFIEPKKLAGCYRTEEGVGVIGRGADKGRVAKGMPWWMAFVFIAGAAVAAWWLSHLTFRGATRLAQNNALVPRLPAPSPTPYPAPETSHIPAALPKISAPQAPAPDEEEKLPVAKGWATVGDLALIELENGGRVWGERLVVGGRYILLDGQRFMRSTKPAPGPPAPPPLASKQVSPR